MYYPGPRGFSWLFTACTSELRKSPKALNTRQVGRKKNLWSLWTWISLSCRCQDQDLTLELGLVDFLQTPKSIRLVLRGWWGYLLLHFLHKSGKNLLTKYCSSQFLYKHSRFVCVLQWFCFWQCLRKNLTLVLEERFPEIDSLNEHQSKDVFVILPTGNRK